MALPDYFKIEQGTAIIWGTPSGAGVTNNMTLDALASAAGREGVKADLGATFDEEYYVGLRVETGTAPTAGTIVSLYLASSYDNTTWPGLVTGADAAYTVANVNQLGPPVNILVATNVTNTLIIQAAVIWRPPARYVTPVIINSLGQAFRDETTASDNDSRVILVPRRCLIQDAA